MRRSQGNRERAAERIVSSRPLGWPGRKTEAKACIFPAVIMKTFSHDLFLPLDRNSSLQIARRGPKMTRKDKEREEKNVLTNGAHSCVNAFFIPYFRNGKSRIIQLITAWLQFARLRWNRMGVISSSKQQSTLFSLSSCCIPDFLPSLKLTAAATHCRHLLRPPNQ